MSQPLDRRWIRVVLVLSGAVRLVSGQDQAGRTNILTGVQGENSCQLRDTIHSNCNSTVSPPPLNTTPIASLCTCNKVYFNIWSACSYASGNNTLPSFDNWASTCTDNAIDLTESASKANSSGGIGITVPAWGNLDVPGNTSFDLQRAVEVVVAAKSGPASWTVFQILAPVISAVVAILVTFSFIYFFKPRLAHFRVRSHRARDFFRPTHRVKNVSESAPVGWMIEQGEPPTQVTPPHMKDPLSPIETNRGTIITIPGNPSVPSSSYGFSGDNPDEPNGELRGVGNPKVPGGRVYPFAPSQQPVPSQSTTAETSRKTSTVSLVDWARGMHIPMPWKSGPVPVTVTPPNESFTMDTSSRPSGGMSTDTISSFACRGQDNPRPSFDLVREHEDTEDNIYMEDPTEDHGSDEGTSLIDKERGSVILIGRYKRKSRSSGTKSSDVHSSSIHSSVKIVSPSNSTSSPRDSNPGNSIFSWVWPRPPVPPVPNHPAPLPPPVQKAAKPRNSALGTSSSSHPLPTIPQNRPMSPIQEDSAFDSDLGDWRRSPSPLRPPLAPAPPPPRTEQIAHPAPTALSMARRPSADNPRPLPLPSPAVLSAASHHEHLSPHQRSSSHTFSASALYEEFANEHSRSASFDSDSSSATQLRPAQRSLTGGSRPLPTPTGTPRPTAQNLPPTHAFHTHQLSGSVSAASLVSSSGAHSVVQFRDPFAPAGDHGRGLVPDDVQSFYATPNIESPDPVRSPPPLDEEAGDPGLLFPLSVRGAGYRGTPN